jgi:hypothetical protein
MGKADTRDLHLFLKPFAKDVRDLALWLRDFVWDRYPQCNELIYDTYNALVFGWTPTDRTSEGFCSVLVGTAPYLHFGFYWGSKLNDPERMLVGNGKQYRFLKVADKSGFPKAYARKLMKEAYAYSLSISKAKDCALKGATITKAMAPVLRRPGGIIRRKTSPRHS